MQVYILIFFKSLTSRWELSLLIDKLKLIIPFQESLNLDLYQIFKIKPPIIKAIPKKL